MGYKFQITLPEDLAAALKREAARLGIPLAELIRETMRERLAKRTAHQDAHPFASIIGIVEDGDTDVAARVDEILYR